MTTLKTLAYFASGNYHPSYQLLPFKNVYLIDRCHPKTQTIGKVMIIKSDCLDSLKYFKVNNIRIDFLVLLNEGLANGYSNGRGTYPLNADLLWGTLCLILIKLTII